MRPEIKNLVRRGQRFYFTNFRNSYLAKAFGIDGVLEAFIDGARAAETKDILKAIDGITPDAQMMSEKSEEIRSWKNIKGIRNDSTVQNTANANAGARILEI